MSIRTAAAGALVNGLIVGGIWAAMTLLTGLEPTAIAVGVASGIAYGFGLVRGAA